MSKAYLVTAGAYSDYHIEKVFTDKKKAYAYAITANKGDRRFIGECEVEEWDIDDDNIKITDDFTIYPVLNFTVRPNDQHEYSIVSKGMYIDYYDQPSELSVEKKLDTNLYYEGYHCSYYIFKVEFPLQSNKTDYTDEELKKIATDWWAKYKAEELGL